MVVSDYELIELLRKSSRGCMKRNNYFTLAIVFVHYVALRFRKFKNNKVKIQPLPDNLFRNIVRKICGGGGEWVYSECCVVGNIGVGAEFMNICCEGSSRKYRARCLSAGNFGNVYVSETFLFNVTQVLGKEHAKYFILPACDEHQYFATEAKVSMITNPYETPSDWIDTVLKNYFSNPKYLRKNDVMRIDVMEFAPALFHSVAPQLRQLHFKVTSLTINGSKSLKPAYVVRGETTLVQGGEIHHFLPHNFQMSVSGPESSNAAEEREKLCVKNCPEFLEQYLCALESCVAPFISSDNWMELRPIFLVEGPQGSGKHHLLSSLAARLGLNFFTVDCSEIQTLSPSQTEAKLRIVLSSAERCTPCLLKLSNIQILGKNSEGKIDERVTSNFSQQLSDLYCKKSSHPLIIIATSESPEIPPELNRNFLESITIKSPTETERIALMKWYLKTQRIDSSIDLSKISAKCSDFLMSDVKALTQTAVKYCFKNSSSIFTLDESHFADSLKSLQSIFSEEIGAPRVPEVHWEDIGGLVSLKREIIRRIEVPLIESSGLHSSGLLLYGPPGTGKTLLAKAVATECKLNFLSVKGPELLNMYVGQSEKNVRDVFERAKGASPCIIFFDELDALAPNRGRSGDSGGVMDRVVSQLLAEMDGLGSCTRTFIIAATNRPDLIDPALLRPGRFDKLLYVGIYSDRESQLSVLKAITRKFSLRDDRVLEEIVEKLPENLTGADLQAVCAEAWLNAAKRVIRNFEGDGGGPKPEGEVEVLLEDFLDALQGLVPSVGREELRKYEKLHNELTAKRK